MQRDLKQESVTSHFSAARNTPLGVIYFDNAATTALEPEVLEGMMPYLTDRFGNPSSIYSYGRETRLAIENARKSVAKLLGVRPGAIFFTSGGTESNNTAISASIRDLGCNHLISSPIEHHAVLHTVEHYSHEKHISASFVALKEDGHVDLDDLEGQLAEQTKAGKKCQKHGAIFHSDCVQTVGHYPVNLSEIPVHFISAASHKFHGPKGVGVLYVSDEVNIKPFIFGGGQERNMRAGTENVYGIVGFARALEIMVRDYDKETAYIKALKAYMKERLVETIPGVGFNDCGESLYTV